MATKFLEPGGDADFAVNLLAGTPPGFWTGVANVPAVVTDFVHGGHAKSIQYRASNADVVTSATAVLADAGSRISFYLYLAALPAGPTKGGLVSLATAANALRVAINLTTAGVLQIWNANTAQIGTDGATLSTGVWYRISLAYTISSTTVNEFRLFVDGVSSISITNATIAATGTSRLRIGNFLTDTALDFRSSDHYVDDSAALTDPGNIWVTAKRPNANGTTNGFTTQIGSGGSSYGTGHSPQVNERALSTTNGWSIVAVGATTEEYNIENKSTGDINISTAAIVDYTGWVCTSALIAETGQIIVNNVTSNISITTTATVFTQIAGSATYPAGTGTDIGMVTDATATTVSLYECGVMVAYIPAVVTTSNTAKRRMLMGIN